MAENQQFGNELRRLRRTADLTLADLAGEIGCSVVHLSEIERGRKNPPRSSKIRALVERIGCPEEFPRMMLLAVRSRKSIEINVGDKNDDVTNMLLALARRCDDGSLDDATAKKINKILGRTEDA